MSKQSQNDDGCVVDTMKMLRLVNRHWSLCATESTDMLRPPAVTLETLLEVVREKFVSLRSLRLDRIRKIDDEYLANLCKLSSLTCVDISRVCFDYIRDITDTGLKFLGSLRRLKDLKLEGCEHVTDVGIIQLGSLASLTTLCLSRCMEITDEDINYFEYLEALRNLDMIYCCKVTSAVLRGLSSLTALTRLCFFMSNQPAPEDVASLGHLETLRPISDPEEVLEYDILQH